MSYVSKRKLLKEYPGFYSNIESQNVKGLDELLRLKQEDVKTTIAASHTSDLDIHLLYYLFEAHISGNSPAFIMRSDLLVDVTSNLSLPVDLSQKLYSRHVGGAIPIDQKDPNGLEQAVDMLKPFYVEGDTAVLFPGGTREFGHVNGMSMLSTSAFLLELRKQSLDENHYCIPCGLVYKKPNVEISFGEPVNVKEVAIKQASRTIVRSIADLTGLSLENLTPAREVKKAISERALPPEDDLLRGIPLKLVCALESTVRHSSDLYHSVLRTGYN